MGRAPEQAMSVVSFDHVGLSVADLERQRRFYTDALGLHEAHYCELAEAGIRISLLRGPDGAALELTERAGSTPQRFADPVEGAGTQGYFHWALAVDDLEATIAATLAAGARSLSQPAPARRPGVLFAYIADPEDNLIELIQHIR
jgi:catechol 2,3-dioxygenase-like lactoylglutathione lyase family enzyme